MGCGKYQTVWFPSLWRAPSVILERYLIREIVKPLLAASGLLVSIFLIFRTARFMGEVANGTLPVDFVLLLASLKTIVSLEVLLSIALHLSVVVALGRLYADSEMTALHACGVSPMKILQVVCWLSALLAVVVACLSLYGRPWAYQKIYWLQKQASLDFDITKLEPGRFHEEQPGDRVIFVSHFDAEQNRVGGVFIQSDFGDRVQVISAKQAYQETDGASGDRIIVCVNARVYELHRDGGENLLGEFDELRLIVEEPEIRPVGYKRKAASTLYLARSDSVQDVAELQWRLSTPVSTLLLGLLGFPLSRAEARKGKYAKLLAAVIVYSVYYNLSVMLRTLVEQQTIEMFPGIWWANGLLAVLVVLLLWSPARIMWARPR